jgi:hypothetical protein
MKPNGARNQKGGNQNQRGYVRGLSVPEKSFLLLELLHFVFVGAVGDKSVDIAQVSLSRDLKSGVLLPNATVSAWRKGPMGRVGPHTLRTRSCIHLLLVEGHPLRVGVGRHWLLRSVGEDRRRANIAVHWQSVVWQLGRSSNES